LFLTPDTVTDIAGNEVVIIPNEDTVSVPDPLWITSTVTQVVPSSLIASSFTPDSLSPLFESFEVIGDENPAMPFRIILRFDEPVQVDSKDVNLVQLLANNTPLFEPSYNLTTDSTVVTISNGPDVTISFHQTDLEGFLALPPILQCTDTAFLQIFSGAFDDLLSSSIQTTDIVPVSVLIGEFIPPELSS